MFKEPKSAVRVLRAAQLYPAEIEYWLPEEARIRITYRSGYHIPGVWFWKLKPDV
jgi:hypothetical protein